MKRVTYGCEYHHASFGPFRQVLILDRVGTSSEHHSLYQYQLANTQNVFLSQMQSETAHYQPQPRAGAPFPPLESLYDPHASELCKKGNGSCDGYGLRILESRHLAIYGPGLYSFYNNYDNCESFLFKYPITHFRVRQSNTDVTIATACSFRSKENCQQRIFSIEGSSSNNITVYNLNTVGAPSMVDRNGTSVAKYSDNADVFPDTIALFRIG